MELLILGRNSVDKGKQLEELTRHLLEEMEYSDIVVNEIRAGGQEIDVRAERRFPSMGGEQKYRVICECKAHNAPIAMPDWLKFLGKVFVEETQLNQQVTGCFIALSGVNGNVAGGFDALREKRDGIELITGDGLVRLLGKTFSIISLREITERVRSSTARQFTRLSLCYYDRRVYWLVEFEDKAFSLLRCEGTPLTADDSSLLQKLLVDDAGVGQFVDLYSEAEAYRRARMAEKIVISELMMLGGSGSYDEVLKGWLDVCTDDKWRTFSRVDIDRAARRLAEQELLDMQKSSQSWSLLPDQLSDKTERMVRIYRHLTRDEIPVARIGCPFYDEHIDAALLDKICEIQGGIQLPKEKRDDCLKLLRWSPQALAWALQPDPMIVVHRKHSPIAIDECIEQHDVNYFLEQLLHHFSEDFYKKAVGRYFYSVRNLREVDTRQEVEIKGAEASELVLELRHRLGIGEAAESLGGGIVRVLLFPDVPEPWELPRIDANTPPDMCSSEGDENEGNSLSYDCQDRG